MRYLLEHKHDNHGSKKTCCSDSSEPPVPATPTDNPPSYKPLIIIVVFCIVLPLVQAHITSSQALLHSMMGYFFIFLSLFKFFDLRGFVDGFSTYDIPSKYFRPYAYLYPFLEFGLGLAYLSQFNPRLTNWITLILMCISGIGVLRSVMSGKKIKCACLGTTLNVPLSAVSILENVGMAVMAAYSLLAS